MDRILAFWNMINRILFICLLIILFAYIVNVILPIINEELPTVEIVEQSFVFGTQADEYTITQIN